MLIVAFQYKTQLKIMGKWLVQQVFSGKPKCNLRLWYDMRYYEVITNYFYFSTIASDCVFLQGHAKQVPKQLFISATAGLHVTAELNINI